MSLPGLCRYLKALIFLQSWDGIVFAYVEFITASSHSWSSSSLPGCCVPERPAWSWCPELGLELADSRFTTGKPEITVDSLRVSDKFGSGTCNIAAACWRTRCCSAVKPECSTFYGSFLERLTLAIS
jgi:hypothetical protein